MEREVRELTKLCNLRETYENNNNVITKIIPVNILSPDCFFFYTVTYLHFF